MIAHDSYFTALASAPIKQSDTIVTRQTQDSYGFYDDLTSQWSASDFLMSVSVDSVGTFLGAATKKATVVLIGIVGGMAAEDLYCIKVGLKSPTDTNYNYVSQGFYKVDTIVYDYDSGSTTITMYDYMWTASNTPYATGFTYPCTVAELAQQVASAIGATLDPDFDSLPNSTYTILADLYANIANSTLLTVVQELAAATGTTARISDTTLRFVPFALQNEYIDGSVARSIHVGNSYGPVTSVVLGRVPQNDNVVLSRKAPENSVVSDFDPVSNTIVVTGHGMSDGTLIRFVSTGSLPAPLLGDTNYFIYTNGSTDSFALALTYADALAGTNLIDLLPPDVAVPIVPDSFGSPYYGYYNSYIDASIITLESIADTQIQINNNQILDNDRQDLLPPLYGELLGIGWSEGKSDTIGLPWHEVGDVINFKPVNTEMPVFINEVHYVFAGSIDENLVSVIPDAQSINYQTAGGVLKTIYNTEIKVDKQQNDIESIVSQQITDGQNTTLAFTEVYQTIDGVTTQIQSIGGGNLILNSVGYSQEPDGTLSFWTESGPGKITSYSSAGSLSSGATSGNAIQFVGPTGTQLTQRINVANNTQYSLGFRVNKTAGNGSATVTLSNDVSTFSLPIDNAGAYVWDELKLENIVPGQNYWDVTIALTGTTTSIEITDLRVMAGQTLVAWDQSHSEILNTQVSLTTDGIRVTSNVHPGDYTTMTPIEFAGYSNASGVTEKVFWVNRDTTEVANIKIEGSTNYGNVIRAIPIASGMIAGLAFVGAVS